MAWSYKTPNELYHFGVLGMKWGKRKSRDSNPNVTTTFGKTRKEKQTTKQSKEKQTTKQSKEKLVDDGLFQVQNLTWKMGKDGEMTLVDPNTKRPITSQKRVDKLFDELDDLEDMEIDDSWFD